MDGTQTRFVALEPDAELTALLWRYKNRTRELVGPQLFLDHPPHLTAFLAVFPVDVSLLSQIGPMPTPRVRLRGWHVFEGDALTGMNTLVCDIDPQDQEQMRGIQRQLVTALSPLRDRAATEARFGPRLTQLSEEQRANVAEHGFPYLGAGWVPHLTVASIRVADWDRLFAELRDDPPLGEFTCPRLREYVLVDEHPEPVGAIDLV